MHRFWNTVVSLLLERLQPKSIVEIGSEHGFNTRNLVEFACANNAVVHVIDPLPKYDPSDWERKYGPHIKFHLELSLNAIGLIDHFDMVLIDGDHNWYTVFHELQLIETVCGRQKIPYPAVLFHDVGWPYGRRDLYYDPERVPLAYRKPYSTLGMRPEFKGLVPKGGLNRGMNNAIQENGPRNGVLTAIEGFLKQTQVKFVFITLPGNNGLGILVPESVLKHNAELQKFLRELSPSATLSAYIEQLERSKIGAELDLRERLADRELDLQERLADLQSKLADRDMRIAAIFASRSWRITAPLRTLTQALRWARNRHPLLAARSGLTNLLHRVLPREGLARRALRVLLREGPVIFVWKVIRFLAKRLIVTFQPRVNIRLQLPLPASARAHGKIEAKWIASISNSERNKPLPNEDVRALVQEVLSAASANQRLFAAHDTSPEAPEVSIVIPVFNQLKYTLWCLYAVASGSYGCSFEIVVVDDASRDGTAETMNLLPFIRYVRNPTNQGFVHSCNRGAGEARGKYVVFLNNDTLPLNGWLDALLDTFRQFPQAGIAGSKLIYPGGQLQEAGGLIWQDGSAWNFGRGGDRTRPEFNYLRSVDYCSGACIAIPIKLFNACGGFDVAYAPAYAEDADLAFRVREKGFAVLYQPMSEVVHLEGITAGTSTETGVKAYQVENLKKLYDRWRIELRSHRPNGKDPDLEKDRDIERRVLFVDAVTTTPDKDAGSLVALHWMQSLQVLGYKVTFIPFDGFFHAGKYTADLQRQGVECVYAPAYPSVEQFLAQRGTEFDLCILFRWNVGARMLPLLHRYAPQAKRIFGVVDLHHLRQSREALLKNSPQDRATADQVKQQELSVCSQCDLTWTPSQAEKDILLKEIPAARVMVSPLTHEMSAPQHTHAERNGVGYLGGFQHPPNVDAVLYFIDEILPLILEHEPGLTFYVAGSRMPDQIANIVHPRVAILGQVEDLAAFFESIRVSVAPLRYGAGVKGKVTASLSHGVPVVGTSIALEGMGLRPDEGCVAADTPEDFAREVVRLYRDRTRWEDLSRAGFRHAEQNFSLAVGTRDLARMIEAVGISTRGSQAVLKLSDKARNRMPHRYEIELEPGVAAKTQRDRESSVAAKFSLPGMELRACRSLAEYLTLREAPWFLESLAREAELVRNAVNGEVLLRGFSGPARRSVVFGGTRIASNGREAQPPNWRETLFCPVTQLNNRMRATAAFAQKLIENREYRIVDAYLSENVTPFYKWFADAFPTLHLTGSEYLGPDFAGGETRNGIRHEDVERLSFDPASFDLVVSCDVLEHVNEPRKALGEFARILRPGGHLLFTIPFHAESEVNRRRALAQGSSVELYGTPEYHGNPMDPNNGSLVFYDFGWEVLQWLREEGFRDPSVLCYWSENLGHLGGIQTAFYAWR